MQRKVEISVINELWNIPLVQPMRPLYHFVVPCALRQFVPVTWPSGNWRDLVI